MVDQHIEISVVSPVYRAEGCVDELCRRLTTVLESLAVPYEIVLVEDGSPDRAWERIRDLATQDPRICGIRLSRNFGQHLAIAAGLAASRGRFVVVMDCDLQDPPELIPQLVEKGQAGFDIVYTRRVERHDSWVRRWCSRLFFLMMNTVSPFFAEPGRGSFSLLSRQVVDEYLRVVDVHSHYLSVLQWLGFHSMSVEVRQDFRLTGTTSYSLYKLLSYALSGVAAQSTRLLHMSTAIGLLFTLLAFVQIFYLIYRKLCWSIGVEGWASLMVVLWFVSGMILFSLGVMGLYLGRMFEHTRNRPLFVVREQTDRVRTEHDVATFGSDLLPRPTLRLDAQSRS